MLKGRTAIITGGSKGIGFAIAKELSSQGANVFICSRTRSELNVAVEKLTTPTSKVTGVVADVSKVEDCKKLIEKTYSTKGRIDILVNNAGIFGPVGPLETNDTSDWERVLAINLLGAVYCSMLVIPYMKKQKRGKIINIVGAGVGGPNPLPRFSGYYTSKTALAGLTQNLAAETETENIQVNAVSPGAVASSLTLSLLKLDKSLVGEAMYKTSRQLKEHGGTSPELTAKMVAFLASSEANHITGRLLSAKWDSITELKKKRKLSPNLYRLRRIDNTMFTEKKGK